MDVFVILTVYALTINVKQEPEALTISFWGNSLAISRKYSAYGSFMSFIFLNSLLPVLARTPDILNCCYRTPNKSKLLIIQTCIFLLSMWLIVSWIMKLLTQLLRVCQNIARVWTCFINHVAIQVPSELQKSAKYKEKTRNECQNIWMIFHWPKILYWRRILWPIICILLIKQSSTACCINKTAGRIFRVHNLCGYHF